MPADTFDGTASVVDARETAPGASRSTSRPPSSGSPGWTSVALADRKKFTRKRTEVPAITAWAGGCLPIVTACAGGAAAWFFTSEETMSGCPAAAEAGAVTCVSTTSGRTMSSARSELKPLLSSSDSATCAPSSATAVRK